MLEYVKYKRTYQNISEYDITEYIKIVRTYRNRAEWRRIEKNKSESFV